MRSLGGITTGRDTKPVERDYLRRCTHFHWRTGTIVMFTRDTGHHSSGWMKNPEFERCRHLSLSFRAPSSTRHEDELANNYRYGMFLRSVGGHVELRPFDEAIAAQWVTLIHGADARYAWTEGAFSAEGRELQVRHYRVFCDAGWQAIMPRGEVYSKDLTESGWRSWSEQQGERKNWIDAE